MVRVEVRTMMSCFGVSQCGRLSLKSATAVSLIIASLGLSGCSADVTRFDSTSFNFNDSPDATPIPSEPVRTSSLADNQTVGAQLRAAPTARAHRLYKSRRFPRRPAITAQLPIMRLRRHSRLHRRHPIAPRSPSRVRQTGRATAVTAPLFRLRRRLRLPPRVR